MSAPPSLPAISTILITLVVSVLLHTALATTSNDTPRDLAAHIPAFPAPITGATAHQIYNTLSDSPVNLQERWYYTPIGNDNHISQAYGNAQQRALYRQWTLPDRETIIRTSFLGKTAIQADITRPQPFTAQEIIHITAKLMPGVKYPLQPTDHPPSDRPILLQSTSHEGRYYLRHIPNPDGTATLEYLDPETTIAIKPKTGLIQPNSAGLIRLTPNNGWLHGILRPVLLRHNIPVIAYWTEPGDYIQWQINVPVTALYKIELTCNLTHTDPIPFNLRIANLDIPFNAANTRSGQATITISPKILLHAGQHTATLGLTRQRHPDHIFHYIETRLSPIESQNQGSSTNHIVHHEIQLLKTRIQTKHRRDQQQLRQQTIARLQKLQPKYNRDPKSAPARLLKTVIDNIDHPDLDQLIAATPSDDNIDQHGKFKPDRNYIIGKWQADDDLHPREYDFRPSGRIFVYENGKRNLKALEKTYNYNQTTARYTIAHENGFHLYTIRPINQNTISINGRPYKRSDKN